MGNRPFAKVVPLTMPPNAGKFAVQSTGAQWGIFDTEEEAQGKAARINEDVAPNPFTGQFRFRDTLPEGGFYVVSDSKDVKPGEQCPVLGAFSTEQEASEFIATLPEFESGRYNLDPPAEASKVFAVWHGGPNYMSGSYEADTEEFDSLDAAKEALSYRENGGDPYYPGVQDSEMWIFFADPRGRMDPYPDQILTLDSDGDVQNREA